MNYLFVNCFLASPDLAQAGSQHIRGAEQSGVPRDQDNDWGARSTQVWAMCCVLA